MNRPSKRSVGLAIAAAIAGAAVTRAHAQAGSDPVVEQARSQGLVGEQVDGYLGFAKSPAADLKARVDAINIQRRAFYTDLAAKRGVTRQEVGSATTCELCPSRTAPGPPYATETAERNHGASETSVAVRVDASGGP